LYLDYVIFSGEKGWERLEAIISTAVPTLEKLRPTDVAFHHAAPDKGLPFLRRRLTTRISLSRKRVQAKQQTR
jgi:hypothetical protein